MFGSVTSVALATAENQATMNDGVMKDGGAVWRGL